MKLKTVRRLPKKDCRFIASWVCNDLLWASTFLIKKGIIYEFSPDIEEFIVSDMNFKEAKNLIITVCEYE